jgi:hypothetical protein
MAKQIILYNLKDSVTEEDYVKWCESFKGPFLLGLNGARSFTLVKMMGGMKGNGQEGIAPAPTASPYKYIGIFDLNSLEDMDRAREKKEFAEEFFSRWYSDWVADFYTLGGEEIYYGEND